ncbi:MAG: hypothetical protein AAGG44_21060 [Planctomycetota bacterium]
MTFQDNQKSETTKAQRWNTSLRLLLLILMPGSVLAYVVVQLRAKTEKTATNDELVERATKISAQANQLNEHEVYVREALRVEKRLQRTLAEKKRYVSVPSRFQRERHINDVERQLRSDIKKLHDQPGLQAGVRAQLEAFEEDRHH